MSVHDVGDFVTVTGTFRNSSDVLTNPTDLDFSYRSPAGVVTTYDESDPEVTNSSTGVYSVTFELTAEGPWFWQWHATGSVAEKDHGLLLARSGWSKILTPAELREYVETDLSDTELYQVILAEDEFITRIIGPAVTQTDFIELNSNPNRNILDTIEYPDLPKRIQLRRPATSITSVVERDEDEDTTTLAADDYRLIGKYTVERRNDGTNTRYAWGTEVTVTYIPADSVSERRAALIELCKLTLANEGYSRLQTGEIQLHILDPARKIGIVTGLSRGVPFV